METSSAAPFGVLLRQYRAAAGLTQEVLAERARLSVRAVSDLERGINRTPRRETLTLLADALALPRRQRALLAATAHPAFQTTPFAPTPSGARNGNLPIPPTPLVGREAEVARATQMLKRPDVRLLTLTGPGGVGKTSLALQVADDLCEDVDDGAYFVALAPVSDPEHVPSAIASALAAGGAPVQPSAEQLRDHLRPLRLLLLLDNFEHLAPAALEVASLLASCPHLKLLVTSRAPLRLRAEHEMPVSPLPLDAACALFQQSALAARPDLDLTASGATATVRDICRRLDGLPLAVELAAVHVRVLSPAALLKRLDARLALLTQSAADLPERQRTLRSAIAWSYDLLSPSSQTLFRQLGTFAGSCTLEAAIAVCSAAPDDRRDDRRDDRPDNRLLAALESLVEQSLLRSHPQPDGSPRFSMLDTIQEYAREQLIASGEEASVRRRHAAYYLALAEAAIPDMMSPRQGAALDRLEREHDNLRAALRWTLDAAAVDVGLRLATALGRFWFFRGHLAEGRRWSEAMLALADRDDASPIPLRLLLTYGLEKLALEQGDYAYGTALAERHLALAQHAGDQYGVATAFEMRGIAAQAEGDHRRARVLLEEGLALARAVGADDCAARISSSLGFVLREQGDLDGAQSVFEECLSDAQRLGYTYAVANSLGSLGRLALDRGEPDRAAALYREGLAMHRSLNDRAFVAWCLEGLAACARATDHMEECATLGGTASTLRHSLGASLTLMERTAFESDLAAARAALGEDPFAAAWSAGIALSPEDAIAYALA